MALLKAATPEDLAELFDAVKENMVKRMRSGGIVEAVYKPGHSLVIGDDGTEEWKCNGRDTFTVISNGGYRDIP